MLGQPSGFHLFPRNQTHNKDGKRLVTMKFTKKSNVCY